MCFGNVNSSLALNSIAAKMVKTDAMAHRAAEHGVSSDAGSATEQSKFQTLRGFTFQSVGIGSWLLKVSDTPRAWEYGYTWHGNKCTGKRFEVVLVSQDADAYCIGAFRRKGATQKGIHEFEQAIDRFARGTIWEASKVTLAKEKACFINSPVKQPVEYPLALFRYQRRCHAIRRHRTSCSQFFDHANLRNDLDHP